MMRPGRRHFDRIERCAVAAALLVVAVTCPARAHPTIVPDQYPTIQAAVDKVENDGYSEAETLFVRPGNYSENVEVHEELTIMGMATIPSSGPTVTILGLRACYRGGNPQGLSSPSTGNEATFAHLGQRYDRLRFTGPVVVCNTSGPVNVVFHGCRFDAGVAWDDGFNYPDLSEIDLRSCEVFGATWIRAQVLYVDSSTFHGPLRMFAEVNTYVLDNSFDGVPGTVITASANFLLSVARNHVRGGTAGIVAYITDTGYVQVDDNRIEGCSGDGIYVDPGYEKADVERNVVTDCGGAGIRALNIGAMRGNRVLRCAGIGLDLSNDEEPATVEGNVVGHCGSGIVVSQGIVGYDLTARISVLGNTAYGCSGTGIVLQDLYGGAVARNIATVNGKLGLDVVRGVPLTLSCNDWFANGDGATSGLNPAATDLAVDPLFCDLAADDVQLRSDSPLLAAPGCGLIGALGKGCEPPPVVIELELKQDVLPSGAHGGWVTAWLEPHAPFAASDVDIASVRLNGVPAASDGHIGDRDRDGIPDLQLRFDRVAVGQTLGRGAVATVTVTGTMRGRQLIGTDAVRIPQGQSFHRPSDLDPEASAPVLSIGAPMTIGVAGRLRVAFTLADASPARLDVLDVAGRVVVSQDVGGAGPGEHSMELGDRAGLAQGIYFLRLRQGGSEARTRAAIVR